MTDVAADADYDLYIYDELSPGTWVTLSLDGGKGEPESVTFTPVAGRKYHILVDPASGFSSSQPYHLVVTYN